MYFVILAFMTLAIFLQNSLHCILFLLLSFLSAAILIISSGLSIIGFLLIILYIGAIAILFLFVASMAGYKYFSIKNNPIAVLLFGLLFFPISFYFYKFNKIGILDTGTFSYNIDNAVLDLFNLYGAELLNLGIVLFATIIGSSFIVLKTKKTTESFIKIPQPIKLQKIKK